MPMFLSSRRLALSVFAATFPALPAFADEAPPTPVQLDPVIVQASPFKADPDALVQPVQVLRGAELDRKRRGTLGETLEGELGVSTTDFGPGVGRPVIRGLGGARVLVLNDGLPSMDASSVSDDHALSIDPSQAEQVEIIKGPASLIYGSAAFAGVINVTDHRLAERVREGLHGEGELSYGGNGDAREGRAAVGYGRGMNQFHADYAARRSDDLDIPGNSASDGSGTEGRIANSRTESQSGALAWSQVREGGLFAASLSRFTSQYGLPAEEEAFIDLEQTRFDAKAMLERPLPGLTRLRGRLGVNVYQHTEFEAPAEPGTKFTNQEQELRLEAEHVPLGAWRGVAGLQVNHRLFDARGEEALSPKTESRQVGLFVVEQRPFTFGVPGQLEVGARVELVDHAPVATKLDPRNDGAPSPDRDFLPVSLSAGALFNLDAATHLRLGLSRSERAPSPEELYAFGPHGATGVYERGDQNLDKEVAYSLEAGIDRHQGRWTWLANAYLDRIENFVYLAEAAADGRNADGSDSGTAPAPGQTVATVDEEGSFVAAGGDSDDSFVLADFRQSDVRFYGVEAETRYRFLADGPLRLTGRLFGDPVRGELVDAGDLPRITPPRYGIGLEAGQGAISAGVNLTRVAAQKHFALDGPTAGYTLLSADLGWKLPQAGNETTLFLRGRNLLDEEGRRATSFLKDVSPVLGRSVYVGLSLRFG